MKNLKRICIISITIFVSIITMSFAEIPKDIINNTTNTIISLSSKSVNTNTEFYLILNLSKIDYTKFKVDITNNNSLIVDEVTEKVSELSTNNVATSFIVDKTTMNLEKLDFQLKFLI